MLQKKFQREGRRTRRRNRVRSAKKSLKPYIIPMIFVAILVSFLYAQYSAGDETVFIPPGEELKPVTTLRIIELVPKDRSDAASERQQIAQYVVKMQDWFEAEPTERPSGKVPRVELDGDAPKVERVVVDAQYEFLNATLHPALDLSQQLNAAGFALKPNEAAIVFARIAPTTPICGEAAGRFAFIFPTACSQDTAEYSKDIETVVAHELLHVLGAVEGCAPHHGRGRHVVDNPKDIMYEPKDALSAPRASEQHIDPGLDDYWGITKKGCPDLSKLPIWIER